MKTALLVVDVQEYFLKNAAKDFLNKIAAECERDYELVAFTAFKNTPTSNFVRSLHWEDCMTDSDASLSDELLPYVKTDNVFTRATYSAFYATNLDAYLKQGEIEKLVICGIDTDACLLATAYSAFDNGYKVEVKFDLTFSTGGLDAEAERILMRNVVWRLG